MAKTEHSVHPTAPSADGDAAAEAPTFRERLELALFLIVEILCLLLFVDFLFVGYYIK